MNVIPFESMPTHRLFISDTYITYGREHMYIYTPNPINFVLFVWIFSTSNFAYIMQNYYYYYYLFSFFLLLPNVQNSILNYLLCKAVYHMPRKNKSFLAVNRLINKILIWKWFFQTEITESLKNCHLNWIQIDCLHKTLCWMYDKQKRIFEVRTVNRVLLNLDEKKDQRLFTLSGK